MTAEMRPPVQQAAASDRTANEAPRPNEPSRTMEAPLSFSFVIPAHNEIEDIADVLAGLQAQTLPVEVVVIDDGSTDGTREFLRDAQQAGLIAHLIERDGLGPAAARNAGVRTASGNVIVFLDADVIVPDDFVARIAPHYHRGCDALGVESRVEDMATPVGRFIQADHEVMYGTSRRSRVGFTQAFSCRREVALAAPFPEQVPTNSGEDGEFFRRLVELHYILATDFSIVVKHRQPRSVQEFWRQSRSRGRGTPFVELVVRKWSEPIVVFRRLAATAWTIARIFLLVPNVAAASARCRRSPAGWRDWLSFWLLYNLRMVARRFGELRGLADALQSRHRGV